MPLVYTLITRKLKHAWEVVPRGGIEPPTQGFGSWVERLYVKLKFISVRTISLLI